MKRATTTRWRLAGTALVLLLAAALPPGSAGAAVQTQCPPDTDGIDTDGDGDAGNDVVCVHLGAGDGFTNMADGRLQYMFGFSDLNGVMDAHAMMAGMLAAQFPAPLLRFRAGQKVYLSLTNVGMMMRPDLFDPHSVHWHGFPNAAPVFDGLPEASMSINMGSTLTYYYEPVEPGTYMYHCHVEATEHMQMGMLGNLYVTPQQDGTAYEYPADSGRVYTQFAYDDGDGSTGYDQDIAIQLASFDPEFHDASMNVQPLPFAYMEDRYGLMNGRGYPETIVEAELTNSETGHASRGVPSLITVPRNQRVLVRLSSLSVTRYFTVTSPSIPMLVVGKGARQLRGPGGADLSYQTSSVTLGGGEANDIILDTRGIRPGTYFLYTTNLNFLTNGLEDFGGMMTEIHVTR